MVRAASSRLRLASDERAALASLAVFARPPTLEAFEVVAGARLQGDPVEVAEGLLRKGLAVRAGGPGPERIGVSGSLSEDVRATLRESPLRAHAEDDHARYFLARAERASARSYGSHAERALDELHGDAPDLLVAFDAVRPRAPEVAARIALAMGDLALFRDGGGSSVGPGAAIFAQAPGVADASGDAELRARTRVLRARVRLELGAAGEAEASLVEAVAIAEGAGLSDAAADARRALGWARLALGRREEAVVALELAIERYRETGDVRGEADSLAARGLLACLEPSPQGDAGSLERGRRSLEVAHALHRGAGDAIRRAKVVDMARLVGLELDAEPRETAPPAARARVLRASAAAHRADGRLWREALDLFRLAELEREEAARRLLLEAARRAADEAQVPRELSMALARRRFAGDTPPGLVARPWLVGPAARWAVAPDGRRANLARHSSMRRVLDALTERRIASPGAATTADALLAIGWPGERVRYESGLLRVYTTIRRLRRLGLRGLLVTRDDGYLLDPQVEFVRGDDEDEDGPRREPR